MKRNMADGDMEGDGDTVDFRIFGKGKKTASAGKDKTTKEMKCSSKPAATDPHRYNMDYPSIGICLIISNKNFQRRTGLKTRDGTDVDAANVSETFSKLGYTVHLFSDQTVSQMNKLMLSASGTDHSKNASFVCVLLSHGDEGVIYGTDGCERLDTLVQCFKGRCCKSLVGKPKLFFIQACRGSTLDDGVIEVDADTQQKSEKIPVEADFLYAYSTAPGYYSWRNTFNGSWFIQMLCEMLQRHSGQLELMQIMTRVNYGVSRHFESSADSPEFNNKKQIPCIVSMLTKDIYFPV